MGGMKFHLGLVITVIFAISVPRASASAVAFGMGLFAGKGVLGAGQHRAFSVITDSRANDIHLRFHDTCQTYKEFKKKRMPALKGLLFPVYAEVSASLVKRYNLNFTEDDVALLWFLCRQEAALLDKTDQVCGLFTQMEACNGTYFCPFKDFKERVAGPHLRHTFESLCTVKVAHAYCPLT